MTAVMVGVNGRVLRTAMAGLGVTQVCLLLAIYQAEILPTINIIDVRALNIYLSPTQTRKALFNYSVVLKFKFFLKHKSKS